MFAVVPMSAWPASICASFRFPVSGRNSVMAVWRGLVHRAVGQARVLEASSPPAVHGGRGKFACAVVPDDPDGPAIELGPSFSG
jgi:hypothetical protein